MKPTKINIREEPKKYKPAVLNLLSSDSFNFSSVCNSSEKAIAIEKPARIRPSVDI
jgi:hypothetical protein